MARVYIKAEWKGGENDTKGGDQMIGCKKAETVTVIKTVTVVGTGTEGDPVREVIQYWSHDGELIGTKQDTNSRHSEALPLP